MIFAPKSSNASPTMQQTLDREVESPRRALDEAAFARECAYRVERPQVSPRGSRIFSTSTSHGQPSLFDLEK